MDFPICGWTALLQEVKKILPVPCLLALAEDLPGAHVERGEQIGGAMPELMSAEATNRQNLLRLDFNEKRSNSALTHKCDYECWRACQDGPG